MGNENGGWWAEGTAFTALMYALRGESAKSEAALNALSREKMSVVRLPQM